MSNPTELFPSIGAVAEETERLPEPEDKSVQDDAPVTDDEDRPVQEIESLCMKCEEQVCFSPPPGHGCT